jgi:hypothetical protein
VTNYRTPKIRGCQWLRALLCEISGSYCSEWRLRSLRTEAVEGFCNIQVPTHLPNHISSSCTRLTVMKRATNICLYQHLYWQQNKLKPTAPTFCTPCGQLHTGLEPKSISERGKWFKKITGPDLFVIGEWRWLHNEELSDLYYWANIIWVIKSRKTRWWCI